MSTKTAPEITEECKERLESKNISNINDIIDHHEVIVIDWDSKPNKNELETVESIFQSVSTRITEKPVDSLEESIRGYSFAGTYGTDYTTYYLSPHRIMP